jgi:RNA polymerase primary sigma factor
MFIMKNTAKTLTLTAKKAPAKSTAQLSVPKTATSYFLETEAAAKVTVVKTRSRLASLKAVQAEAGRGGATPAGAVRYAAAEGEAAAEAVAETVHDAVPWRLRRSPTNADPMPTPATPAAPPVIVRKRGSKLAALKAAAEAAEAVVKPRPPPKRPAAAEEASAPRMVRTRTRRVEPASSAAGPPPTGTVSTTTDAATLAAIDTSGYLLPQVKVPGRRGRKPSEFVPENDEIAALNAVERAEMKAASKLRERKAKGIPAVLARSRASRAKSWKSAAPS